MFKEALDDTATIRMRCHPFGLLLDRFNDEVHGIGRHLFNAFLNDVVAVHIFNAANHMTMKFSSKLQLRLSRDVLDCALDHTAAMGLLRQSHDFALKFACQLFFALHIDNLEQFLHNEVARAVAGKFGGLW